MITLKRFRRIEAVMRAEGYGQMIEWSEAIPKPADADAFAEQAVYVICNSGMMNRVAVPIFNRCMIALNDGRSSTAVFGHPGKAKAIDWIWGEREQLFATYLSEADPMDFWPAAGLMDTEIRCFIELEDQHGTKEVYTRVQA